MAEALTIANALRLAQGCIADAKVLAESGSRNAAYLAEQALEQLIRAIATSEQLHIERSDAHQLDKTLRRLPTDHPERAALGSVVWVEAYATTFRYTSPSGRIPPSPDKRKLAEAILSIERLLARSAEHFRVDLNDEASPALNPAPMQTQR